MTTFMKHFAPVAIVTLNSRNFIFNRYEGKVGLAALVVAASMTMGSSAGYAAAVCGSTGLPVTVPITAEGIFIDLDTRTIGTSMAAVPAWNFNVYSNGGSLNFLSRTDAAIDRYVGTGSVPDVLAAGVFIGPASTYATSGVSGPPVAWRAGVTGGYVGIQFARIRVATLNYGWVQMTTTAGTGFPATITAFCFQDSAQMGINAGTTPVSLQSFSVD